MSEKKIGIGVDLGTGMSCVAHVENNEPVVYENNEGRNTTPSIVFIKGSERKIGEPARRGMVMNPKNTVSFVKRFMGADWDNPDVQKMISMATYEVVNDNGKPKIKIDDKTYSPEEISAMILGKMKQIAEDKVGCTVTDAVITVPAWFDDKQRNATKAAGEIAGLNVLRIINEPTAAILSSNIDTKNGDKIVLVNDIGCGTEDVSICEVSDGMIEVLASYGDVFLGGQNYDMALTDYIVGEFKKDTGIDIKKDNMAMARVIEAAEKAKCELSSSTSTEINLPYITVADGVPQMLVMTITRAQFEKLTYDLTRKVVECAREALKKSGKTKSDLSEILLVGGSSRIPAIQDALSKEFNVPLNKTANFDEAVARGAAVQANILVGNTSDNDVLLLDVTPISMGIEAHQQFDPQARLAKIIEANTTIPVKKSQVFTTAVDNQDAVDIVVLQGERTYAVDCKRVGTFRLDGIAPAKAGVPQIEVTFDIDANGIINVSATDKATGKEQKISIQNNSLTDEEIERMKADAEAHKEEDAKRDEEMNKLNSIQMLANSIKSMLEDEKMKDKITDDEREKLTPLTETLEEKLKAYEKAEDKSVAVKEIEEASQALQDVYNPIISRIYAEANPQTDNGQANPFGGIDPSNMFSGGTNPFDKK